MSTRRDSAAQESTRKAITTTVVGAVTVTAGIVIAWPLAIVGAVPTAILGWDWWKHRVKNGLRV